MFLAIYTDQKNKIIRYYYLKDNNIYYNEYSNQKFKIVKQNSLFDFYQLFRTPIDSIFLENDNQYEVYLDNNGYKHYLKNGTEDFLQFYLKNGTNYILSSSYDNNIKNRVKKFLLKGAFYALPIICSVQLFNLFQNKEFLKNNTQSEVQYESAYENSCENLLEVVRKLDTLDEKYKNEILNSGVIESIVPYCDDLHLAILEKSKLNDLTINYYDNLEHALSGYYDPLVPNVINLQKNTNDKAFSHEFIHLIQSPRQEIEYLVEPVAELMSVEFFGGEVDSYVDEVNNLKLLICTIGPEPILQCSFGGDSSKISEILKNNLETEDYEKMMLYMSYSVNDKQDCTKELQKLIEKLYKNIYGTEMKDTLSGYDFLANQENYISVKDNRCYLNEKSKETKREVSFEIDSKFYDMSTKNMDIISTENVDYYRTEITEEKYNQLISNNNYEVKMECSSEVQKIDYSNNNKGNVIISINGDSVSLNMQSAIENGYVKFFLIASEDKINLEEGNWVLDHQNKKVTANLLPVTSKNLNNNFEVSLNMQADQMIEAMINGTVDGNGNLITTQNDLENNKSI